MHRVILYPLQEKMRFRTFYLLLIIVVCNGCKPIYRLLMGAKPSRTETERSVLRWLHQNIDTGIQAASVLTLAPEGFPQAFEVNPIIITQNNTCILYNGCTQTQCFKTLADLIKNYQTEKDISNSPALLQQKLSFAKDTIKVKPYLKTIEGKSIDNLPEHTIILPFALFLGKNPQRKELLEFISAAKANQRINWTIRYLCIDKQAWWGEAWNRKIEMGLN